MRRTSSHCRPTSVMKITLKVYMKCTEEQNSLIIERLQEFLKQEQNLFDANEKPADKL